MKSLGLFQVGLYKAVISRFQYFCKEGKDSSAMQDKAQESLPDFFSQPVEVGCFSDGRKLFRSDKNPGVICIQTTDLPFPRTVSRKDPTFIEKTFPSIPVLIDEMKEIVAEAKPSIVSRLIKKIGPDTLSDQEKSHLYQINNQIQVLYREYRKRQLERLGFFVDRAIAIDFFGRYETRNDCVREGIGSAAEAPFFSAELARYFELEKVFGIEFLGQEKKPVLPYVCDGHAVFEPMVSNQEFIEEPIDKRHRKILEYYRRYAPIDVDLQSIETKVKRSIETGEQVLEKLVQLSDPEEDLEVFALILLAVQRLVNNHVLGWEKVLSRECLLESKAAALFAFSVSGLDRNVNKEELEQQALRLVSWVDLLKKNEGKKFDAKGVDQHRKFLLSGFFRLYHRYIGQRILDKNSVDVSDVLSELVSFLNNSQPEDSPMLGDGKRYGDSLTLLIDSELDKTYGQEADTLKEELFILRWLHQRAETVSEKKRLFLKLNEWLHESTS